MGGVLWLQASAINALNKECDSHTTELKSSMAPVQPPTKFQAMYDRAYGTNCN